MEILFWASAGTTLASAAMGAIWLLWIADDDEPEKAAPTASLSVSPSHVGLALRLQL